jgi:hypothetical protein
MIPRSESKTCRAAGLAAALVAACFTLSCGGDSAAPCPTATAPIGVVLVSHGRELYRQTGAAQHGTITVRAGDLVHAIECTFLDRDNRPIAIANNCQTDSLAVDGLDPAVAAVSRDAGLRFLFNVSGVNPGNTTLQLRLVHEMNPLFTALAIPVVVTNPTP